MRLIKKFQNPDEPITYLFRPTYVVPGTTPETSSTVVVSRPKTEVEIDREEGLPVGTTHRRNELERAQRETNYKQAAVGPDTKTDEEHETVNNVVKKKKVWQPINTALNALEYVPVFGDAVTIGRALSDASSGEYTSMAMLPLMFLWNKTPFGKTGAKYSKQLINDINLLEAQRAVTAKKLALEKPIGLSHSLSDSDLLKTLQYDGKSAAPSLALSRFEKDGLIHANKGYASNGKAISLYFEPSVLDKKGLYWLTDGWWPTYSKAIPVAKSTSLEDILAAKRQIYKEQFADPSTLMDMSVSQKEAIESARNFLGGYAEYTPNDIFDLGRAKYAITETKDPIILQWFKDNGISTDKDAFLKDLSIRFKNGGKVKLIKKYE